MVFKTIIDHHLPLNHYQNAVRIADFIETLPLKRRESDLTTIEKHHFQVGANRQWVMQQLQETLDVPSILFKYIPRSLLQHGCPNCLRASQLAALNDVMECSVMTLKDPKSDDDQWSEALLERVASSLGIALSREELDRRRRLYGDARISTVIQKYLDQFVGVLAFSTDPLIATMWAHYAQNSGFVVGYNTEMLGTLGIELRKVLYLELAPFYDPIRDNIIKVHFVNEEKRERDAQEGIQSPGIPILQTVNFVELQRNWRRLAKLLFVKGKSWEYEKEVRLLVDQQETRLLKKKDKNGLPIRVLDIPTEAIEEVYAGFNTPEEDVKKMIELVGRERNGWKLMRTSSHAYRMQVTLTEVF